MALNFNQFAAEANAFLKKYTKEMNLDNDKEKAGRILSSILHALRDVISPQESLQLIAQFPMFLKAVYVNGWTSHKKENGNDYTDDTADVIVLFVFFFEGLYPAFLGVNLFLKLILKFVDDYLLTLNPLL